jgi:hypothetical protein
VGPIAGLEAVVKRKIPSTCRDSNPSPPIIQPVAQLHGFSNSSFAVIMTEPNKHTKTKRGLQQAAWHAVAKDIQSARYVSKVLTYASQLSREQNTTAQFRPLVSSQEYDKPRKQ